MLECTLEVFTVLVGNSDLPYISDINLYAEEGALVRGTSNLRSILSPSYSNDPFES